MPCSGRLWGSLLLNVLLIGAAGGVMGGMLGVGGAVVLLPLLTTFAGLSLKDASNVTIVQVVASSLISWAAYQQGRLVHLRLALYMGVASAVSGLLGGYASHALSSRTLEWLFLVVVLVAIALLLLPVTDVTIGATMAQMPPFHPLVAVGLGASVGVLAGLLGAGGGFLIVPVMIGGMHLPTRLAIGSSPVVILISASAAMIGKLLAGQIRPDLALALVVGAAPSTFLGTLIGRRLPSSVLRWMLGLLLVGIAMRGLAVLLTSQ